MKNASLPLSTYRLQFNKDFSIKEGLALVKYLNDLGISHYYSSPLSTSKPGSTHGYDVIDHTQFNPEIGSEEEFKELIECLKKNNMGLILDIVPNHMFINELNPMWIDVLENGKSSTFADFFDIDWHPPHTKFDSKVLLPLLDQLYGDALESQNLKVAYREGVFFLELGFTTLPTDPKSWAMILDGVLAGAEKEVDAENPDLQELKSIITALTHFPATTELPRKEERKVEKEVIKRRINTLTNQNASLNKLFLREASLLNGIKGQSESFDRLEAFLDAQPYRLCYWRVANDEINYRRFFDILDLAGLCTEKKEVFEKIHALIIDFTKKGFLDGLRIDHIDGLKDPKTYLSDLRDLCKNQQSPFYIVVEKILTGNESLRQDWPVQGTVGYDFLNQSNGLFIDQKNKQAIYHTYFNFIQESPKVFDVIYECKKLILLVSMSSELFVLSRHLARIAEKHRNSRDFTEESLRSALRDVIACFPVYRSYIEAFQGKIELDDKQDILKAVSIAKRLNPSTSHSIFDFIQNLLLLEYPQNLTEDEKKERNEFVMRFQQMTGPVMAKGFEDTVLYRFFPLLSLNEVGCNLSNFGMSVDQFHAKNQKRSELWPYSMLSTSTHDTKRSEDVRCRLNVISEIPELWQQKLTEWSAFNAPLKFQDGENDPIPNASEEYYLYQTLIGIWPIQDVKRIQNHMEKALREAKVNTSWINPNVKYEQEVFKFIEEILKNEAFMKDLMLFMPKINLCGMFNSLSSTILKMTSPGIPDIYQGNEIWEYSLADPDNRRAVDFKLREHLLKSVESFSKDFLANPEDGKVKLYVTSKLLNLRKNFPNLFLYGSYIPLTVKGDKEQHIIAFMRKWQDQVCLVITTRFYANLLENSELVISPNVWKENQVLIPDDLKNLKDILTNENLQTIHNNNQSYIDLEKTFTHLPFAVIFSTI